MIKRYFINNLYLILIIISIKTFGQYPFSNKVIVGAKQTNLYIPILKNKNVAIIANQSSVIDNTHLIDSLLSVNIKIKKIFCPEHGFRGVADAGKLINNNIDTKTGLPIISLYGKHKKPTKEDLKDIDIIIFDIQDVGVRFYTYISTLHYVMESCAENSIPIIIMDRPNPNGYYIDGPVLDTSIAKSFIGMHPVPLVYGMTIGEYALMINGEKWLKNKIQCDISVITCKNYNHNTIYKLPIKPSPNLPNMLSIILYPSLGLFEGTIMSIGRGTDFPFQVFGHPKLQKTDFTFTPKSKVGATNPKYKNTICYGFDLRNISLSSFIDKKEIQLNFLIKSYKSLKRKNNFFNNYFYRLAGTKTLQQQIEKGLSEFEIRKSWQNDINNFKKIRKKYLLYTDFNLY